jgi:hypothetical protein
MKKQFVCLANSTKLNGRCLAGIEILNKLQPVLNNTKPNWIRPVSNSTGGEISTNLVNQINLLDILEIDITNNIGSGFQSENVLFDPKSLIKVGSLKYNQLINFCSDEPKIFGNKGKAVHVDDIDFINHSLLFICVNIFSINSDDPQHLRLEFEYNDLNYDLPITDPVFIDSYNKNNLILSARSEIFLAISLAVEHLGWHSKLVAGII